MTYGAAVGASRTAPASGPLGSVPLPYTHTVPRVKSIPPVNETPGSSMCRNTVRLPVVLKPPVPETGERMLR